MLGVEGIKCMGESAQQDMGRLTSEGDKRRNVFYEDQYYSVSRLPIHFLAQILGKPCGMRNGLGRAG